MGAVGGNSDLVHMGRVITENVEAPARRPLNPPAWRERPDPFSQPPLCSLDGARELRLRLKRRIDDDLHVLRHRWAGVGDHDLQKRALFHVWLDVSPYIRLGLRLREFAL